jgi:pimeloyl-ACP methyl ester carboxylesterase
MDAGCSVVHRNNLGRPPGRWEGTEMGNYTVTTLRSGTVQARLGTAVLALIIVGATVPSSVSSQSTPSEIRPDPGHVEVDGSTLYMVCEGEATPDSPTVVFENGLGEAHETWHKIQPAISQITRACTYDRLGVGESDPVGDDDTRTPFELAHTLHRLLETAEIDGPYVLVGHSIAGIILLAYPHLYPDEVAGLVFVDASHPQQWNRFRELDPERDDTRSPVGSERFDRGAATDELAAVGGFGDLPMAIVHQAQPTDSPMRPIWIELQHDHASRSTNSRVIPGANSGHYVHIDEPELVLEAIQWVLNGG